MPNDYLKKEPSKSEKMLYQLFMSQQQIEKSLWSISAHLVALGILTKVDPREVAEILVNGDEQIKEYSQKVNGAVKKLEEERVKKDEKPEEKK